jgi:molybdenum cofactor cytidylyltransferase
MHKALPGRGAKLAAVILAAGASTRLGRSKQLVRIRSVPLLVRAVRLARHAGDGPVIVVLGADALRLRHTLRNWRLPVAIAMNPRWQQGMAGSLQAGFRHVPDRCAGALVLLTDQVRLTHRHLAALVARWRRQPGLPAAAMFDGHVGVPAILPAALLPALRTLAGDQGARQLLRQARHMNRVPLPAAACDLDVPTDLETLLRPG